MSKKGGKKESVYEKVAGSASNVEPYHSATLEEICECLKHEDAVQIILATLKNRKDADAVFRSALLTSPKFWFYVMTPVSIVSIFIACSIGYCFYRSPEVTAHFVEKAVNSKIPALLPPPQQQ